MGVTGATGPTGADSTVTGPTGPASTVTGPTGPQGVTGADSTVTGPQGPTGPSGADSTVTGPTGPSGNDSVVTGPTGPIGSTGPASVVTGPTGPTGLGSALGPVWTFTVGFNAASQLSTVTNLPAGWSYVLSSATSITITHNVGANPIWVALVGQQTSGSNTRNLKMGPGDAVASTFNVIYDVTQNTTFLISNITTSNFGTVSNGSSTVYVQFLI